jgi:hypothetical protein
MGGTAIPGSHWITIDFHRLVRAYRAVIDFETAYADNYRIQVKVAEKDIWTVLYDWNSVSDRSLVSRREEGQSPGVKAKRPLHVVHDVDISKGAILTSSVPFRYLQLFIEQPAAGWGVSVWQLDIYGEDAS